MEIVRAGCPNLCMPLYIVYVHIVYILKQISAILKCPCMNEKEPALTQYRYSPCSKSRDTKCVVTVKENQTESPNVMFNY